MLTICDLSISYGTRTALDRLDFAMAAGEIVGVLGANGAGKSTLVAAILGLRAAPPGTVSLFGQAPGALPVRRRIGAMLQDAELPAVLQVRELIEMTRRLYPHPLPLGAVAELLGLEAVLRRRYGELSGGQKRRVQCALALCGDGDLLILDEPTNHMDEQSSERFWRALLHCARSGKSIILVSHKWDEIDALADRVLILEQGRAVLDSSTVQLRRRFNIHKISFSSSLLLDDVARLAQVRSARAIGRKIEVLTGDADAFVDALKRLDTTLCELQINTAPLDEAIRSMLAESNAACWGVAR
ncbi:ABC transporter ATP-binding protein [Massilia sp. DWR3-1-1]|uniref:ABC transporter ATP-binding protein n=1 Tax=Massilia sp. DWR3-1-1 TaxID=2804559 RepID=UPI003CF2D353